MKKKLAVLLMSSLLCVFYAEAAAFDAQAEAEKLLASGADSAQGQSPETGHWLLAVGLTDAEGKSASDAIALASLEARRAVAACFTTTIAAVTEMQMQEDDDGSSSSFAQWARSDVSEVLRGVRIVASQIKDGQAVAVALLTEKTADATRKLRAVMEASRPGTVEADGIGFTKEAAVQAACRSALEQVCGTSVIASTASLDNDSVKQRAFSDVQGLVSAYRILEQEEKDGQIHVRIVAEVDLSELQESYGAQMKSIGDPLFYITSTNDDALRQMSDWFIGKGFKTTTHQGTSDYKIDILTKALARKHPSSGKEGLQVQLTITCYDKAGVQLFSLQNDPRKATSFIGDAERQSQICIEKAVKQIEKPLHERVQRAVSDLANNGRSVRIVFRNVVALEQSSLVEAVTSQLNDMPGASSATSSYNDATRTATVRFTLKGNPQDLMDLLRQRMPALPPAVSVSTNKIIFEL